jgi:hypothetical protein
VSFTLVSNANGTATLTISPKELLDAAALQHGLRQYGIPAPVTSGRFQLRSGGQQTDFMLINTSSYTCASTPPQTLPPNGAQFQILPARS